MWPQLPPQGPLDYGVPMPELVRTLFERRVPHTLAIYAGASWALIEFVAFAVDEFLLSPHLTRVVLAGLLLLLPSVFMIAWFHGKPGKDREEMARTEKIGIPANLLFCAVGLWVLFGGKDLGAATRTVTVQTEDGEEIRVTAVKSEFRKRTALFPLEPGPGLGEEEAWAAYAVPRAIEYDLITDDFFLPIPTRTLSWGLQRRGYSDLLGAPLSLKREIAREVFAEYVAVGEIDKGNGRYRVSLAVHEAKDGTIVGQTVHEGSELLALVDEMSEAIRVALGIHGREGVEDLPVRQILTEDAAALEEFFKGMFAVEMEQDVASAIEHFTTATTLDPTLTTAYRELARWLTLRDRPEEALAAIRAAMDNLHRLPERARFQVRTEYYLQTGETDRAAAILEMWLDLYPEDLNGLDAKWRNQQFQGDWEGALATVTEMRRLNPGNGFLLQLLAEFQEELGLYEEAAATLAEYGERFPDDEGGVLALAGFQRRRGEHDVARDILSRAVLLHPLSADLGRVLANLDLETGRFEDARRGFERARDQARNPVARTAALAGLKRYHRFRGELQAAIGTANAWLDEFARAAFPVPDYARLEDFALYLDAGLVAEAAALLEEVAASDPWLRDFRVPHGEIVVALESQGVEAALELHEQAAEVADTSGYQNFRATLTADLGMIQERAGDYTAAADSYRAALDILADYGSLDWGTDRVNFGLGAARALRKAGRLDESEAELRQVLFHIPAHPLAHLELALLMETRGDTDGAVEHLQSALAAWENADESYAPAQEARSKLAELGG